MDASEDDGGALVGISSKMRPKALDFNASNPFKTNVPWSPAASTIAPESPSRPLFEWTTDASWSTSTPSKPTRPFSPVFGRVDAPGFSRPASTAPVAVEMVKSSSSSSIQPPLDRLADLKDDLTRARSQLETHLKQQLANDERTQLLLCVKNLEELAQSLQNEAGMARSESRQALQNCAVAVDEFEARADQELQEAKAREELLKASNLEQTRQRVEAEDMISHSMAEADRQSRQRIEAEDMMTRSMAEIDRQNRRRMEAEEMMTLSMVETDRHLSELQRTQSLLHAAEQRSADFELRCKDLEAALEVQTMKHAEQKRFAVIHEDGRRLAEEELHVMRERTQSLEEALARATRGSDEELQRERVEHVATAEQLELMIARAKNAEDELFVSSARQAEDFEHEREKQFNRLAEAERASRAFETRAKDLERVLFANTSKEAELLSELRAQLEMAERTNVRLLSNLREARFIAKEQRPRSISPRLCAPPPPPLTPRRPPLGSSMFERPAFARPLASRPGSARFPSTPQRCATRRSNSVTPGLPAVTTDRTDARSRYDEQGRLLSYDANGRRA